jgi:hypothetical protein
VKIRTMHIAGAAAAVLLAGGIAVTGVALASPTATTYSACLGKLGVLYNVRVNKTPRCLGTDTTITWSQTGPAGPAGAQGLAGAAGPQGLAGPAGQNGKDGTNGSSVLTSSGPPSGTCTTGDSDVDVTTGEVWSCSASAWADTGSSLDGPQGPAGPAGPAGTAAGFGTGTQTAVAGQGAQCTVGEVILTAGAVANGIPANGQLLLISDYTPLFQLLGTEYGGNGTTNFALPDLGAMAPDGLTYSICVTGVFPERS